MATRWQLTVVALCTLLATSLAHADIYRWDTGEVIPGTEGIEPGPGVQLDHMDLEYASLDGLDLAGANFEASDLACRRLRFSTRVRPSCFICRCCHKFSVISISSMAISDRISEPSDGIEVMATVLRHTNLF